MHMTTGVVLELQAGIYALIAFLALLVFAVWGVWSLSRHLRRSRGPWPGEEEPPAQDTAGRTGAGSARTASRPGSGGGKH